jgi:hypothetical protein
MARPSVACKGRQVRRTMTTRGSILWSMGESETGLSVGAGRLELLDWRRSIGELYAAVRISSQSDPSAAWREFRKKRDEMFKAHAQSPLGEERRGSFAALSYFPYNASWRLRARVVPIEKPGAPATVELHEGKLTYRPFAMALLQPPVPEADPAALTLFWLDGYGGGLFLPFKDRTAGAGTFGGGRYLFDTIKGADLGAGSDWICLDFNFAYNPSCAYDPQWVCPLAPRENALPFRVEAGERSFS